MSPKNVHVRFLEFLLMTIFQIFLEFYSQKYFNFFTSFYSYSNHFYILKIHSLYLNALILKIQKLDNFLHYFTLTISKYFHFITKYLHLLDHKK
jgi:hypothetical protein